MKNIKFVNNLNKAKNKNNIIYFKKLYLFRTTSRLNWLENVEWIYKADINDFNKIKEFINKYLNNNNVIEKHIDFNKKIKDIFIEAIGNKFN